MKMKPFYCCQYCIQELESRGEKLYKAINDDSGDEEKTACEWCKEESDDLTPIYFK